MSKVQRKKQTPGLKLLHRLPLRKPGLVTLLCAFILMSAASGVFAHSHMKNSNHAASGSEPSPTHLASKTTSSPDQLSQMGTQNPASSSPSSGNSFSAPSPKHTTQPKATANPSPQPELPNAYTLSTSYYHTSSDEYAVSVVWNQSPFTGYIAPEGYLVCWAEVTTGLAYEPTGHVNCVDEPSYNLDGVAAVYGKNNYQFRVNGYGNYKYEIQVCERQGSGCRVMSNIATVPN